MGYRGREIESKLLISGLDYRTVSSILDEIMESMAPIIRVGSSVDTYWPVTDGKREADFLRVRERDGIRQITVKGKDRDGDEANLNRIEVDIDCVSETHKIHRLVRCLLGRPAGTVSKTYRVWELESEYDTVCCYEVTTPKFQPVVIEVEARSLGRMLELESLVLVTFRRRGATIERAPGSLYEMLVEKSTTVEGGKK